MTQEATSVSELPTCGLCGEQWVRQGAEQIVHHCRVPHHADLLDYLREPHDRKVALARLEAAIAAELSRSRGELAEKDKEIERLGTLMSEEVERSIRQCECHEKTISDMRVLGVTLTKSASDRAVRNVTLESQLSETRAERDAARALLDEARCPECAADGLYHRTRDRGVCQWCDERAAAIKKQGS